MTELKTLKDLSDNCLLRKDNCCVPNYVKELKQEAIKWVKLIEKDKTIGIQLFTDRKKRKGNPIGTAYYGDEERKIINREKIEFIKHFFNITEEELKLWKK